MTVRPVVRDLRQLDVLVGCGHRWENRGTFRDSRDAERAARPSGVEIEECPGG